ncbi:MAG: cytidylate kinase-like family protein [Candidatus Riflebacteria bacterium]|nr:cytidylate kinase-like family protein [Candidatus Riflebacteria bacterium]
MSVITISREIGSGAAYISLKLAEALQYSCVDKEMIHEIAKKMEKNKEDIEDFEPDTYNRISVFFQEALSSIATGGRVFHTFGMGPLDWEGIDLFRPYPIGDFDHDQYIDVLKGVVSDLAQKNNIVILGRGGQCILKGMPDAIHVRIVADMNDRIKRITEEQKIDEEKAKTLIEQHDDSGRKFFEDFFDVDLTDPHLYHVVLNTSKIGIDDCVNLIRNLTKA